MKRILISIALAGLCALASAQNLASELGSCWESGNAQRYNEIADKIRSGRLTDGGEEDVEAEHAAWISLLRDFEAYWSENFPRKLIFTKISRGYEMEPYDVQETVEVEDEDGKKRRETRSKTEYREKPIYSAGVSVDFNLKYSEMRDIVLMGLRRAKISRYDIPPRWPENSVYTNVDENSGSALLVEYGGKFPASLSAVSGVSFFLVDFDIRSGGRTLAQAKDALAGGQKSVFENLSAESAKEIDSAIENGTVEFVPTEVKLLHGTPQFISKHSTDWISAMQKKSVPAGNLRAESAYKKSRPERNPIDEAEAKEIAAKMMVDVAGDGSLGSFKIGQTEVTQRLYKDVMGFNPSAFVNWDRPVETLSWNDALVFCNRLSELCGKSPAYSVGGSTNWEDWNYEPHTGAEIEGEIEIRSGDGFRIPTEEEWMYAARGGSSHEEFDYSGRNKDGVDQIAWHKKNSRKTSAVSQKEANSLGLFDMTGNVWEWCFDIAEKDPNAKVAHGGSWTYDIRYCKITDLYLRHPNQKFNCLGLRLVSGNSGSVPKTKVEEAQPKKEAAESDTIDAK